MRKTGVYFSLSSEEEAEIWAAYDRQRDDEVLAVVRKLEETWDTQHLQETDKAWDAIHRSLGETWPRSGAVLGGECVYYGDDYVVRYLDKDDVKEVSTALGDVTYEWFAQRFALLRNHKDYAGAADEDDLKYTWNWFEKVRPFFARSASEGRALLFTAC